MIEKRIFVYGLAVVLVLGTLGFNGVETAGAHGVQAQLQSRFIRIEDVTINRQSLQTGETLTLQGTLVSLVERDLTGWLSIYTESNGAGNRWEMLARDPPGNVFDIAGNSVIDYKLSAKALEAGVYHVHTQLNVAKVGPGLGPGQTVVVEGEPIIKPIPYTNVTKTGVFLKKSAKHVYDNYAAKLTPTGMKPRTKSDDTMRVIDIDIEVTEGGEHVFSGLWVKYEDPFEQEFWLALGWTEKQLNNFSEDWQLKFIPRVMKRYRDAGGKEWLWAIIWQRNIHESEWETMRTDNVSYYETIR